MNVRPSNTEPLLRLNLEALDRGAHGAQAGRGARADPRVSAHGHEHLAEPPRRERDHPLPDRLRDRRGARRRDRDRARLGRPRRRSRSRSASPTSSATRSRCAPLLRAGLAARRRRSGSRSPPTRSRSRSWRSWTTPSSSPIPGAMEAGLGTLLFWGSLAFALAVAWVAAFPVNRCADRARPRARASCTHTTATERRRAGPEGPALVSTRCRFAATAGAGRRSRGP